MVERLLETLTKRRGQTFYNTADIQSATNDFGKSIFLSSISMWDIVNQLGKHDFCD